MKVVAGTGVYPGPNAPVNGIMHRNQKELAACILRARGAGETSMKIPARARPTGEAARAVWKIYDLPLNPDVGVGVNTTTTTASATARPAVEARRAAA